LHDAFSAAAIDVVLLGATAPRPLGLENAAPGCRGLKAMDLSAAEHDVTTCPVSERVGSRAAGTDSLLDEPVAHLTCTPVTVLDRLRRPRTTAARYHVPRSQPGGASRACAGADRARCCARAADRR
jgi:hypothetical protein